MSQIDIDTIRETLTKFDRQTIMKLVEDLDVSEEQAIRLKTSDMSTEKADEVELEALDEPNVVESQE